MVTARQGRAVRFKGCRAGSGQKHNCENKNKKSMKKNSSWVKRNMAVGKNGGGSNEKLGR